MNKNKYIKKIYVIFILFLFLFSTVQANTSLNLNAKAAILVDDDSGKVLYENGNNTKVYPASTTKILTAILALENLDLNKSAVASKTAVNVPYGSSNIALRQGEIMSIKDLIYGMMLKSGNDAANVLAEEVSGNISSFVELMNKKLKELGCNNSHFVNAHGYHDNNHYTTPNDMMKLLSYAIKNEEFVKVFSTSTYTIAPTNKTKVQRKYQNTNRLILTKSDSYLSRYYEYCIGGKTGFTDEAGRALVAYGIKDNKHLLIGVFGVSPNSVEDLRYTDAINLFEYGFNNFEKQKVLDKSDYSFSYSNKDTNLLYKYSISNNVESLTNTSIENNIVAIDYKINLDYDKLNKYDIKSVDYKNQVIGKIKINFRQNSSTYDKEFDLLLDDIQTLNTFSINNNIMKYLLITMAILIFISISKQNKKKTKKANNRISKTRSANKSRRTTRTFK